MDINARFRATASKIVEWQQIRLKDKNITQRRQGTKTQSKFSFNTAPMQFVFADFGIQSNLMR